VLPTGRARGTLRVRFEQTGRTAINPHLEFMYGGHVRGRWQRQPGTDLTEDFTLDGDSPVAYIGVWDEDDDAFSDTPYRLVFRYDGTDELPNPQAVGPLRFAISQVNHLEAEPNDDHFNAMNVPPGTYVAGRIGRKGDVDFFKVDVGASAAGTLQATLQQVDASPIKPKLVFYDEDRAELQSSWHSVPGIDLAGQQRLDTRYAIYYVAVSDSAGDAESAVPYILSIEVVKSPD
jgi:hypothetical protein